MPEASMVRVGIRVRAREAGPLPPVVPVSDAFGDGGRSQQGLGKAQGPYWGGGRAKSGPSKGLAMIISGYGYSPGDGYRGRCGCV